MLKIFYCLLFVTIQYGDINGQPDAQQINQHFYDNLHKLVNNKYEDQVESEVFDNSNNLMKWRS